MSEDMSFDLDLWVDDLETLHEYPSRLRPVPFYFLLNSYKTYLKGYEFGFLVKAYQWLGLVGWLRVCRESGPVILNVRWILVGVYYMNVPISTSYPVKWFIVNLKYWISIILLVLWCNKSEFFWKESEYKILHGLFTAEI